MDEPKATDSRGNAEDRLDDGILKLGRSAADDEQKFTESDKADAEYDLHMRNVVWKAVGRRITANGITAVSTTTILW